MCNVINSCSLKDSEECVSRSLSASPETICIPPWLAIADNGGSFVGAEIELRKLLIEGKRRLTDFAVLHKMRWKFITPLSPHQGGMYESLIEVIKRALRISTGEQILSWNEMATVFAEVKSILNSRPLTHMSDDPNDPRPLTPNHLLLG